MIAVDTNILVYANRVDSPLHHKSQEALRSLATGRRSWAVPWPCLHEFLSVVTHPRVYQPPTDMATALRAVNVILDTSGVVAISESDHHAALLAELTIGGSVVGARIQDARIAAICLGHGVTELWTADRDFSYFPALRTRNPLVD